jgi:DTW domain-containing protein YfiP
MHYQKNSMNLCLRCRRRLRTCVCELLKTFPTQSRFIILMHPKEYKKEKVGTGRFSHLLLENSRLVVGVDFDENITLRDLLADSSYVTYLLYPGSNSVKIDSESFSINPSRKAQFIILDGTWPCAKKMMTRSRVLHHLPRISFSQSYQSEFLIKHQPKPGCLSTVESLYYLIAGLKRQGLEDIGEEHEILMKVFHHTINQQIEIAQDSSTPGYRRVLSGHKKVRLISKKWDKRQLLFGG